MKFYQTIKTLDKKQRSRFLVYIQLYHKPESAICKVAFWLDTIDFWKESEEIDASIDWMLDNIPFQIDKQILANAITKLGTLMEEFLGWLVWKNSGNLKKSNELLGLAQKSLSDQYIKIKNEVLKVSKNEVISIWDEHYKMMALFHDYYFGISPKNDNYTNEFNQLISTFIKSSATIAQVLRAEIKNREHLLSESWKEEEYFFRVLCQNETSVKHIMDELIIINSGNQKAYTNLLDFIKSPNFSKYSPFIQYCTTAYCINFITGKIKEGHVEKGQELLDLYEFALENKIFTLNDSMPLKKFINIISLASKMNQYEWAEKIVRKWANTVDRYNTPSIVRLGNAIIDLHQENYEQVIKSLTQLQSSNFQHKLRARWTLLRAHYELNNKYAHVMKAQIDNFRRFVLSNEKRINKSSYDGLKSSIRILKLILNKRPISYIQEFYLSCEFVYERKWILAKIKSPV